jgi:hypothetical protein
VATAAAIKSIAAMLMVFRFMGLDLVFPGTGGHAPPRHGADSYRSDG